MNGLSETIVFVGGLLWLALYLFDVFTYWRNHENR
jgi:hypothetical protein